MVLGFDFDRLRSGPFEGPAIVKPPALPGDTYFQLPNDQNSKQIRLGHSKLEFGYCLKFGAWRLLLQ
jgi:hypothetical protein